MVEGNWNPSLAAGANGESTLTSEMEVNFDFPDEQQQAGHSGQNGLQQRSFDDPFEMNAIYDQVEVDPNDDYVELLGREIRNRKPFADQIILNRSTESNSEEQKFRTGYVYSAMMMLHAHPETDFAEDVNVAESVHPEKPERIARIRQVLHEHGCLQRMKKIKIRDAVMDEIRLVHREDMWRGVQILENLTHPSVIKVSARLEKHSLYVNQHTGRSARLSCGGVIELCDAVASRKIRNGFAIVRPPGHHAEPQSSMGFCFFNNVAVAVRFLQEKYGKAQDETRCERILILDWDVHHGNGTQTTFYNDPNVLFISLHRYEGGSFYPGGPAGAHNQCGGDQAKGRNVNIPWPTAGMDDGDYIAAFQRIVMPIAIEFSPDIVLISAGFDAAAGDQLGECYVTPAGYGHMTHMLSSLAEGRVIVALEGGYDLEAISKSALHVTEVLLGDAPQELESGTTCGEVADKTLELVRRTQAPYWQCLRDSEANENEDENLSGYALSQAIASHRAYELTRKFILTSWPITNDEGFNGQILCSPTILTDEVILLFAHDMGNLRMGLGEKMIIEPEADLMRIVDSSSDVIEWAQGKKIGLLDLCIIAEHQTKPNPVLSGPQRQFNKIIQSQHSEQQALARELLLHVWDNIVNILMTPIEGSGPSTKKIMLMGMGTACDSILHLILEREMKGVCGVVQIPGYAPLPATTSDKEVKRKWYFRNSQIYVPYDHPVYQNAENGIVTAKRFGKLVRSEEKRAVQILKTEFENVTDYIEKQLLED